MRYKNVTSKVNKETGNRVKEFPYLKNIPPGMQDIYVQTIDGDRMDLISNQYYGTPKYWWVIALANGIGKGTLFVKPGIQLRIPSSPQSYVNAIV